MSVSQHVAADMDKESYGHYGVSGRILIEEKYKAELEQYKVENFVEDGKHYSHDHPLRLMSRCEDDKEEMDDDDYKSLCSICGVPILSSPSYSCSLGCKFFLHQPCALNLPTKLLHAAHGPRADGSHILYITKRSYQCEDCEFSLHPLVAFPHLEIKTKHMSHAAHSLVVFCKMISCECDACGREQKGFFFYCRDCDFWIHQDCTILPTTLKFAHRPYPFILAYSLPYYYHADDACIFCKKRRLVRHNGVYFSPQSLCFAHAACGSINKFASEARLCSIQLPDDEWDNNTFPILALRRYAEINPLTPPVNKNIKYLNYAIDDGDGEDDDDSDSDSDGDGRSNIDWSCFDDGDGDGKNYHKHCFVQSEDADNSSRELSLGCDLCTRSIHNSSSFHKCDSCDFVAHKVCADILPLLKFSLPEEYPIVGKLYPNPSETFFNSIFYCFICRHPCNGLCYYFDDIFGEAMFVDLECIAAPTTIYHVSHGQHLLIRSYRLTGETPLPCCPDDSFLYDVYKCILCDYYIHTSCAMLPKSIVCHEYDEHLLHLAFTTPALSYSFCEVCEEDMDLNYWFYQCRDCEKTFHINCIPSLGYLSKVKFGGMLSLPHCHDHPLALTRMLTVPSQRCGHCTKIIRGLHDQMTFFCSHCHYWLHFSCARDIAATPNSTTNPLRLYSEIHYDKFISELRERFQSVVVT